jgi:hypothetical protein
MLIRRAPALGVLLLLVPMVASGFTPTFESVRSSLHGQLESLKGYQVDAVPEVDSSLLIRHWQEGMLWRQEWILNPDTDRTTLLLAAVGQGRTLQASFPDYRSIPLPFLSIWHPLSRSWWDAYRINTKVMNYQFLDDRPCLVIGADYGQTRTPQLWVDNERSTPLRLLVPEFDIQWLNYHRVGNYWLPKTMVVTFPDSGPHKLELAWRGVNNPVTHGPFSKEALLSTYAGQRSLQYVPGSVRPLFDRFPKATAP